MTISPPSHAVAEGWKDHDPVALGAAERIRHEVLTRYGIDTHDVGSDAAYLESGIQTITAERARLEELALQPGRDPQGGRRTREGHAAARSGPG
jgi:hypothetical protein